MEEEVKIPHIDVDDFDGDDSELLEALDEFVETSLEDTGIGYYEWHGATGYDSQIGMTAEGATVTVRYSEDVEYITVKASGEIEREYTTGRGRRQYDHTYTANVEIRLISMEYIENRYYCTYEIEVV